MALNRARMACMLVCGLPKQAAALHLPSSNLVSRLLQTSTAALDTNSDSYKPTSIPAEASSTDEPKTAGQDKPKAESWAEVVKRVASHRTTERKKLRESAPASARPPTVTVATPKWLTRVHGDDSFSFEEDYAVLGTIGSRRPNQQKVSSGPRNETEAARALRESLSKSMQASASINANFDYSYGSTYLTTDLNPYARQALHQAKFNRQRKQQNKKFIQSTGQHPFSDKEVRAYADYRNVHMLRMFVHDAAGTIKGRDRRLFRAATHRKTSRAIRTARSMALLPFVGRHPFFESPSSQQLRGEFDAMNKEVDERLRGMRR